MEILAIIPARGGSKGLPRKNVRLLRGRPLIYYTIREAKLSKLITRIIVSTEDREIAEISRSYDVEVQLRPPELSRDETPIIDVILYVIDTLGKIEGYKPDIIVLLQPTSPLRRAVDIDNALKIFMNEECDSVVSVYEAPRSLYWSFKIDGKYLKPIFGYEYLAKRRQELPKLYIPNGAIYVSTPEKLRKYRSFYSPKTFPYIMPYERSIDIDSEIDLLLAETILSKLENDHK